MDTIHSDLSHPDWSSEELRSMLNQALALEFIRLKKEEAEKAKKKSGWSDFFSSTAFTTILTVFVGTIGGTIIANSIQEKSKTLSERQQIVDEAFTNVAKTVAASQEIIDISSNSWDENHRKLTKKGRQDIADQKRAYWKSYNSAIGEWRVQRERVGFLLVAKGVASKQTEQATNTWDAMVKAVEVFTKCAITYNSESSSQPETEDKVQSACSPQRAEVQKQLHALAVLTEQSNQENVPFYKRWFSIGISGRQ